MTFGSSIFRSAPDATLPDHTETLLSRFSSHSLVNDSSLSASQAQVDGLVSRFTEEATNWRSLAAMATGSLFYRFGRIGTLALASRLPQAAPLFQAASYGIGLGAEVTAFEGSSRFLAYASGDRSNANLWRWSGRGGWSEGLSHSLVTFGMLKSFGHLGSEQNVVLQHVMSDLGMVGGHQVSAALGFTPRPEGSLASQFLEAEITNLQLGAGMSLLHLASPRLAAFERGLDLSIRARETTGAPNRNLENFFGPQEQLVFDGAPVSRETFAPENPFEGPQILLMSSKEGPNNGKGTIPDPSKVQRPDSVMEVTPSMMVPPSGVGVEGLSNGEEVADGEVIPGVPIRVVSESALAPTSPAPPAVAPVVIKPGDADAAAVDADPQSVGDQRTVVRPLQLPLPPAVPNGVRAGGAETLREQEVVSKLSIAPPPSGTVESGMILAGRYEVKEFLGAGGFGNVYKVLDQRLGRIGVIKVPRAEMDTVEFRPRFSNEIRITAALDPRRVVGVYDLIELADGRLIPVMEYVPGHDLSDIVGQLSVSRRLEIFAEICEGVASAHRRGFVHRDLKPANIRITSDGHVKIMDWGLAKPLDEVTAGEGGAVPTDLSARLKRNLTVGGGGMPFGTPGYIAPEAFLGGKIPNPRSLDNFALGAILYEMMSGRHPFVDDWSEQRAVANYMSTHPSVIRPVSEFKDVLIGDYPPIVYEVEPIARRSLEREQAKRFQNALEIRDAVLMAQARVEFRAIGEVRTEMKRLAARMVEAWDHFDPSHQIDSNYWDQEMYQTLYDVRDRRAAMDQRAIDLIAQLAEIKVVLTDPNPAKKMIAELSWMRLLYGGDRMPEGQRRLLIDAISKNDVATAEEKIPSMKLALETPLGMEIRATDWRTGKSLFQDGSSLYHMNVKVLPYERDRLGNYSEGAPLLDGPLATVLPQMHLKAGYYVIEVSYPGYAPMRVPFHMRLKDVRRGLLEEKPHLLNLEFIPQDLVPSDFDVIHGGYGYIGHDYIYEGDPANGYSQPLRKVQYSTYAISRVPPRVRDYKVFIDSELSMANALIRAGKIRDAGILLNRLRNFIPRNQAVPQIPEDRITDDPATLVPLFEKTPYLCWRVRIHQEDGLPQFSLIDPWTHHDRENGGYPILEHASVSAIPYQAVEAFRDWRRDRDNRDYEIMSAEENEIMARGSWELPYPWGYHPNPAYLVSRLVFEDTWKDSYPRPVGSHPMGQHHYRDRSPFGPIDVLGNTRKWTSTVMEPDVNAMAGLSVRTGTGPYGNPDSRTLGSTDNWAVDANGSFRLVLRFPRRNP
ncbi:MAG: bifunctional serine/threonine-protein kinase/formylglycine-generating enzyme family protein [bacterium]